MVENVFLSTSFATKYAIDKSVLVVLRNARKTRLFLLY